MNIVILILELEINDTEIVRRVMVGTELSIVDEGIPIRVTNDNHYLVLAIQQEPLNFKNNLLSSMPKKAQFRQLCQRFYCPASSFGDTT